MSHGKAWMPWGKHKGVRVRLLPDNYLSWLTTCPILKIPEWNWLKESVLAELRFRGLRADLADTADPTIVALGENFMKTYSFPVETFHGRGNGCVEEIEAALKLVHDDGYTPMVVHCSMEAKSKIASACLSTATNSFIFMSYQNQPDGLSGGYLITKYRDKYSNIELPIVADLDGIGFVIEALAPNQHVEKIPVTPPAQPLGGRKISLEGR